MKSIYAFILGAILMIGASPVYATVLGWDLSGNVFKPLQNAWTSEVKVPYITATSTTATSTLPTLTTSKAQISTLTSQNCLGTNSSGLIIAGVCSGSSPVYLASSTGYTIGGVAFATGNGTLSTVATGTLTDTVTGLSFTDQTRSILGGATVLGLDTGYSIPTTNSLLTANASTTGNLAFWSGNQTIGNVATGTLTETITGLELNATRALVGGSAILALTSGYVIPTSTLWSTVSDFYTTPSSRITAGTGIDWSGNTLNGVYTAGDALTLTGEDFDFDGGATPAGELGGTWASPTIDDSLAVTSWNLTTPTLTSFFGTPCTGNTFLQDIGDTGTFTCAEAAGGGGGGGSLSTTTDIIGVPTNTPELVSYVTGDVMFGGSASTSAEFQFDDDGGQFIISSTSNSNATATIESSNNAQAVRIGDDSGVGMENIFSTVATMITRFYGAITAWIIDVAKVAVTGKLYVATTTYNGAATTSDALVIDGYTNSGEMIEEFCTTAGAEVTQVAADAQKGCGRYAYIEDAAGVLDTASPAIGTSTYFRLRPGAAGTTAAAGDGMGVGWYAGMSMRNFHKNSPAVEFAIRQDALSSATSTFVVAGITNGVGATANFAAEPTEGMYILASSTQANYLLVCNSPTGASTYVDTGIASSTTKTSQGNPFTHWRLEITGTSTAVQTVAKVRTVTNQNFTEVGSCYTTITTSSAVAPTIAIGKSTAGLASEVHFIFLKFWYRAFVF